MDRQYDWMTNRFVQDFVNVSIQGLNLESQSVANGDDLCESGVEHFDVDALIDVKEPTNSNCDSMQPVTVIDSDEGLNFDAVITTGKDLTELGRNIKNENKLNNPFHSEDGESNFAQHRDNPKAINDSFGSVFDPITNSDLDTIDRNDLEKVRTSTGERNMDLHPLKKEDVSPDGAQKYLSPDTTDDLQSVSLNLFCLTLYYMTKILTTFVEVLVLGSHTYTPCPYRWFLHLGWLLEI